MRYNEHDVIRIAEESDAAFTELLFCNVFGELMSVTIPSAELEDVFRNGFSFDASRLSGFMGQSAGDLVLHPSPESMTVSEDGQIMRIFCTISRPDGTPFECDGRFYLYTAAERAKKLGLEFSISLTGEFYLFRFDDKGKPVKLPADNAGLCGAAPFDGCGAIRREICAFLEQEDVPVRYICHGEGPGQNVVCIKPLSPVTAADSYMAFMRETRMAAQRAGVFASFMPKPVSDEKGSSLEIAISCREKGSNIFRQTDGRLSNTLAKMIGGLIRSLPSMTLFLNSTTNSYARLEDAELFGKAAWSRENADTALRLKNLRDNSGELLLRTPDSSGNIYFSLGLIINACIEGINQGASAPRPVTADGKYSSGSAKLPTTLTEALKAAENDGFIRSVTDTRMLGYLLEEKRKLCREFEESRDKESFETAKYFGVL